MAKGDRIVAGSAPAPTEPKRGATVRCARCPIILTWDGARWRHRIRNGGYDHAPEPATVDRFLGIAYPATDGKGKYHVAAGVADTPVCSTPVLLDRDPMKSIHLHADRAVHPIVCKRCVRIVTAAKAI